MIPNVARGACFAVICLAISGLQGSAAAQEQSAMVSPAMAKPDGQWWVSGEFGEGQLKLRTGEQQGHTVPTFALGYAGGRQVGKFARAGVKVNGWLLQAFDLNNPTVGESVSNVMGVVDVFPVGRRTLFVRGGWGWASYTNNRFPDANGHGTGWEAGAGYEVPLQGQLRLVPMVEYATGSLGDVHDLARAERRYSAVEFKLGFVCRFGGRGR